MIAQVLEAAVQALRDYVALHVLTCLVPAFLLAGALVTFVSRDAVVTYLGSTTRRLRSFTLAAGGSIFIAACSCTVIPLASGLYYGGAGIGAAFIVLWVAPAANVLALSYTGTLLGAGMVGARLLAAFSTALVVGGVMTWVFRGDEAQRQRALAVEAGARPSTAPCLPGGNPRLLEPGSAALLGLLALSLLAPNYLVQTGPYAHKVAVWAAATAAAFAYARARLPRERLGGWLRESWWFVRLIFPLLLAGVFLVGIVSALLPPSLVERWLGGSSLRASFAAAILGALSYFATMTEAPFVARLMGLGMGKGPALALLLAGPGLSLPNMLTIGRIFGARKAAVYVLVVIVLSTVWAWVAGNWIL